MSFSGNFTVLMAKTEFRIDQHAKIISHRRYNTWCGEKLEKSQG